MSGSKNSWQRCGVGWRSREMHCSRRNCEMIGQCTIRYVLYSKDVFVRLCTLIRASDCSGVDRVERARDARRCEQQSAAELRARPSG